jgi:hypothetical protein
MITQDKKLEVFESFRVDRGLPKFRRQSKATRYSKKYGNAVNEFLGSEDSEDVVGTEDDFMPSTAHVLDGRVLLRGGSRRAPWYARLARVFSTKKTRPPEVTVDEFFRSVKCSTRQAEVVAGRAEACAEAISRADGAGQSALKEQLVALLAASRAEALMVAVGLGRYLDEATVAAFAEKTSRAVRLDWVANFARPIPEAVLAKKREADELGAFDNYAVMHYDPEKKNVARTAAEEKAARDPILFGLVRGRRRLYYVGDWVDEQCDLTLEELVAATGAGSVREA